MSKRDEYVEKMKIQLDEFNAKLSELEAKRASANAELQQKFDEKLAELREHAATARARMEELKEAGEEKWDGLVEEGEKVHKAFVHSFNYFKSQLK